MLKKERETKGSKKDSNEIKTGFSCEVCFYDFGEKRELRCPRCGALQKCGMSCTGNCLKCNLHRKNG